MNATESTPSPRNDRRLRRLIRGHVLRFVTCLALLASLPVAAAESDRWERDIRVFEEADRTNPPPAGAVLFVGSSSIRLWRTLAEDFPEHAVINRGFGGSQIIDSVAFAGRIVLPYRPRLIVMYAGGNDLNAGKTPARVLADFQAFVRAVHAGLPETRIAYIAIAPNPARWFQVEQVKAANELIERHTRTDSRLTFINVFPYMLASDGQPRPDIFSPDCLHMNARGYVLWAELVRPYLWP